MILRAIHEINEQDATSCGKAVAKSEAERYAGFPYASESQNYQTRHIRNRDGPVK